MNKKFYYQATVSYNGRPFLGFQYQKEYPTIQEIINQTLIKFYQYKITTSSASRTDKGVHALEQVIKICSDNFIEQKTFIEQMNRNLPPEIQFLTITESDGLFRPASDSLSKEYRYYFTNTKMQPNERYEFIHHYTHPLNLELFHEALALIVGEKDFKNFCSLSHQKENTTRIIYQAELKLINPKDLFLKHQLFNKAKLPDQCFEFRIHGNGFLKQMIRHLMSALWMVSAQKITIKQFKEFLNGGHVPQKPWRPAPPYGLFLCKVHYK